MTKKWRVSKKQGGLKAIEFLSHYEKELSNKQLKKQIESGALRVNGNLERFASKKLAEGDWVEFKLKVERENTVSLPVLYEDEFLLVSDKPEGLVCDQKLFKESLLVHRLDKETSGVLILAKTAAVEEGLLKAFRERKVDKEYLAIVQGIPEIKAGKIENRLGKISSFSGQSLYGSKGEDGLLAITSWKLIEPLKRASLLACFPETGRTHQIRVHLAEMGHPILGDLLYGREIRLNYRPNGMLLHAAKISFKHPITGQEIIVSAPLPGRFQTALEALR